jgi:uncharacterized protein (TIGR00266 family)
MQVKIEGAPAFGYLVMDLDPGEMVMTESGAMMSMDVGIDLRARMAGGFFTALFRRLFGGESFFVNEFCNRGRQRQRLVVTQSTPGDVFPVTLNGEAINVEPGAFVACTAGVSLSTRWAGFSSLVAREGLFKLRISGAGTVWLGAYGGVVRRNVDGVLLVDSGHLLAYSDGISFRIGLAGGIFSSLFGGEGLVSRLKGRGVVLLQTRSLDTLTQFVNSKL